MGSYDDAVHFLTGIADRRTQQSQSVRPEPPPLPDEQEIERITAALAALRERGDYGGIESIDPASLAAWMALEPDTELATWAATAIRIALERVFLVPTTAGWLPYGSLTGGEAEPLIIIGRRADGTFVIGFKAIRDGESIVLHENDPLRRDRNV